MLASGLIVPRSFSVAGSLLDFVSLVLVYTRLFPGSAACLKRLYEIAPLERPTCKAQMRIIASIQDASSIRDIMNAQGIADLGAPPLSQSSSKPSRLSMNSFRTTPLNHPRMTSRPRFRNDRAGSSQLIRHFSRRSSASLALFGPVSPS